MMALLPVSPGGGCALLLMHPCPSCGHSGPSEVTFSCASHAQASILLTPPWCHPVSFSRCKHFEGRIICLGYLSFVFSTHENGDRMRIFLHVLSSRSSYPVHFDLESEKSSLVLLSEWRGGKQLVGLHFLIMTLGWEAGTKFSNF